MAHTWTLVEIPFPFSQEALEVCVDQDVKFVHVLLNQVDRDLIRILYVLKSNIKGLCQQIIHPDGPVMSSNHIYICSKSSIMF